MFRRSTLLRFYLIAFPAVVLYAIGATAYNFMPNGAKYGTEKLVTAVVYRDTKCPPRSGDATTPRERGQVSDPVSSGR